MFLFPFKIILHQLQVILFQKQIFERLSLGAKERNLEPIRAKNTMIWYKNVKPTNQKLGAPHITFCCFCFFDKLSILVYF